MKTSALAPIEVEILLRRRSPQKIETKAGLAPEKNYNAFLKFVITINLKNTLPHKKTPAQNEQEFSKT